MKIAIHLMNRTHWFAHAPIARGLREGFTELGHDVQIIYGEDIKTGMLLKQHFDLIYTSSHWMYRRYLTGELKTFLMQNGTRIIMRIDSWRSLQTFKHQIRDGLSLANNKSFLWEIDKGIAASAFVSPIEQGDERMCGFKEQTGKTYETVPFGVARSDLVKKFNEKLLHQAIFIGSRLGQKQTYIKENFHPLCSFLPTIFIGQDWSIADRLVTHLQKFFQVLSVDLDFSGLRSAKRIGSEHLLYNQSLISLNCHLEEQRITGGDCNERTFKIAGSLGLQMVDDVTAINKYFVEDSEIIICRNKKEWIEKALFITRNPEIRFTICRNAFERVIKDHLYVFRADQMIKMLDAK